MKRALHHHCLDSPPHDKNQAMSVTVTNSSGRGTTVLGALALVFVLLALYWGLVKAPPDAFQGEVQRIMYLHIPTILTAYLSYFIVFIGSCLYLWKREPRDD